MNTSATEIAARFVTHLHNSDLEAASALLHPNTVWRQPGSEFLSGAHQGKDAVLDLIAHFAGLGLSIELIEAYECDDRALCRIIIRHRLGAVHEFQLISVEDSLVRLVEHYGDTTYLNAVVHASRIQNAQETSE